VKVGRGLVIHTFSKVRNINIHMLFRGGVRFDNALGSCGLQYKLVEVPGALRTDSYSSPLKGRSGSTHSSD